MDASSFWTLKRPVPAYVALAAAALSQRNLLLADLLWAITILALCVALFASVVAHGATRAMAIGFAVMAATQLACQWFAPRWTLSAQMLDAAGYRLLDTGELVS